MENIMNLADVIRIWAKECSSMATNEETETVYNTPWANSISNLLSLTAADEGVDEELSSYDGSTYEAALDFACKTLGVKID